MDGPTGFTFFDPPSKNGTLFLLFYTKKKLKLIKIFYKKRYFKSLRHANASVRGTSMSGAKVVWTGSKFCVQKTPDAVRLRSR